GPAGMIFNGDTYIGLNLATMDDQTLQYANQHLRILSGLYGYLKPFDKIEPYRLEMGSNLTGAHGKNLYDFWEDSILKHLLSELQQDQSPFLFNLASNEYFKVLTHAQNKIKLKKEQLQIIDFKFFINKAGNLKSPGFATKRARGQMARFILEKRIEHPNHCKDFKDDQYRFNPDLSSDHHLVFIRPS
ncbi:MAG: peroxide stress protein YaaA, partial [Pseudomonadota bacterium]